MKSNIIYLSLIQILRFIVPILTFPYLTKVLGVEGFGYLGFSIAIINYSMIICQYGFDLTATSKVSKIRNEQVKLNKYCSGIYLAKTVLFILAIFIMAVFLYFIDDVKLIYVVIALLPMAIGNLIVPIWLFQGLEMMKELTLITLISRICILPFVFILIESTNDIYLAAFLQAAPFLLSAILSCVYLYSSKIIKLKKVKIKYSLFLIKSGWNVFLTSALSSVYLTLFPVIIGVANGPISVGYFNVADTIRKICISFFSPIYQTLFPRVNLLIKDNKNEAKSLINKFLLVSMTLAIIGSGGVMFFSNEIIIIISNTDYLQANSTVIVMMFAVFFGVVNNFFGVQTLIPVGLDNKLREVVMLFAIIALFLSFPIVVHFGYFGAACLLVLIEVGIFLGLFRVHKKNHVNLIFKI